MDTLHYIFAVQTTFFRKEGEVSHVMYTRALPFSNTAEVRWVSFQGGAYNATLGTLHITTKKSMPISHTSSTPTLLYNDSCI